MREVGTVNKSHVLIEVTKAGDDIWQQQCVCDWEPAPLHGL